MTVALRCALGAIVAGVIALSARRAGSLDGSGAVAATLLGAVAVAAGWTWGGILVAYFVASSSLSRYRAATRALRTEGRVAKGGRRDAWQVLANGAAYGIAALVTAAGGGGILWAAAGAGALAASTADTWATEIGTLSRRPPRSIVTWRVVGAGTSGGVTLAGLGASVAGAAFIAGLALLARWPVAAAMGALAGGIAGSLLDSLAGALLQDRRRCPGCGTTTERRIHPCGAETTHVGGIAWIDNDAVNVLATVGGAVTGAVVATSLVP